MSRIGIIGAGAWGTALATVARRAGADVVIWGRNTQAVDAINTGHENPARLPGIANVRTNLVLKPIKMETALGL